MSLKLASNNSPAYTYFSEDTGVTPINVAVILDGSGGTEDSTEAHIYLVATVDNYTSITVEPVNEVDTGINYQVSLTSGSGFAESVTPPNMDASGADVVDDIYVKAVVANDGTVSAGSFTAANIRVTSTKV